MLDVPMYFVYRNGTYHNVAGQSFRAFMEGRLPGLPGELPSLKDWESHLTTVFPEVWGWGFGGWGVEGSARRGCGSCGGVGVCVFVF